MIASLSGTLQQKNPPYIVLDVAGVGYEVEAPLSVFYNLPDVGQPLNLFIQMIVRDDALLLYGFASSADKAMFQNLIKINGVGAKMALGILSGMSIDDFTVIIRNEDVSSLVRLPGIGKKTAERLIVEMKDRLGDLPIGADLPAAANSGIRPVSIRQEAVQALIALGYKASEANRRVRKVAKDEMQLEDIIKLALQG